MEIISGGGGDEQEVWAFVKEGDRIELGAQAIPSDQPTELIAVWRAEVRSDHLRKIITAAHEILGSRSDSFRGRLTGYGPTKEFLDVRQFMYGSMNPTFDAYRAELETPEECVVIWANVRHGDNRSLAEASDNIGLSVPFGSFIAWGRCLIAKAVWYTRDREPSEAEGWLDAAYERVAHLPQHERKLFGSAV
jgi:hypothetical protein